MECHTKGNLKLPAAKVNLHSLLPPSNSSPTRVIIALSILHDTAEIWIMEYCNKEQVRMSTAKSFEIFCNDFGDFIHSGCSSFFFCKMPSKMSKMLNECVFCTLTAGDTPLPH